MTAANRTYPKVTVRAAGMSLRDWFAGQALAGIAANPGTRIESRDSERDFDAEVTRCCYRIADAMMERRK